MSFPSVSRGYAGTRVALKDNMRGIQLTHRLAALIAICVALTGCGSAKNGVTATSLGSNGTPQAALAECNQIGANTFNLAGAISSFWNPNSQSYIDSWARIRFTSAPVDITQSDTKYIQVLRWEINTSTGQPNYQPNPVGIVFVINATGQYLNSSTPVQQLSKNTVQTIINQYGLSAQGIDLNNFFSRVLMIAQGIGASDDALAFAYYDSAAGTAAQASVSVLLAPYAADPYKYRATHDYPALYSLHPNIMMPSGLLEADYVAATNAFCQQFLN